jgi:hypothetical protein
MDTLDTNNRYKWIKLDTLTHKRSEDLIELDDKMTQLFNTYQLNNNKDDIEKRQTSEDVESYLLENKSCNRVKDENKKTKEFKCKCGKIYKYSQGLSKHKKNANKILIVIIVEKMKIYRIKKTKMI